MMAKPRGRGGTRKGAGRPPYSKGRAKVSYFCTRITKRTRDLLEAEARRHGKSLAVVAEHLLELGLNEKAKRRDPKRGATKAFCFLVERLNHSLLSRANLADDPRYAWHANPYMFEAFRTAVLCLLDALRPRGEIVRPPPSRMPHFPEGHERNFTFPEAPRDYGIPQGHYMLELAQHAYLTNGDMVEIPDDVPPDVRGEVLRWSYGLADAAADLGLMNLPTKLPEDSK